MNINRKKLLLVMLVISCLGCFCFTAGDKAFSINKKLGRGINLGNALEAPKEGQWGITLRKEYLELIKQAGFDSIRVPIRWSAHAEKNAPYTIDPNFFERVDWVIDNSLSNSLYVIINMHHYEEIFNDPNSHAERFIELWKQIAEQYKNQPDSVLFEFLNEPHNMLDDDKWNKLSAETLKEVRKTNPDRIVLIGPGSWNNLGKLDKLQLPADDDNIIVTIHYYEPFQFTHQGASWIGEQTESWLGTKWTGTDGQKTAVIKDFEKACRWGKEHNKPVNLGEFGANSKADMDSRARWTSFVARQAEMQGFSWHYWEFCAYFGVYDKDNHKWRQPLLKALISDSNEQPD
ncbi:MAG: glycoside hydrolase family 5 protein [Sedimentisphaerales bacterium]|nr:glycoside hydrolase family 5 protein [Sedimentisphaerales bacterium]